MVNTNTLFSMLHFVTQEYLDGIYMGQQQYPICNNKIISDCYLKDLKSCTIFASPLLRSRQSVDYIIKEYNHLIFKVIYLDELMERCLGDFEGQKKSVVRQNAFYFKNQQFIVTKTPPNGEDISSFRNRVEIAIEKIFEVLSNDNILIVTHLQILRMIYFIINNIQEYSIWYNINYKHGEVVKENYGKRK